MKQSLQLRLGQQLTMTPQLQQAIRLLQLSTLELQTEIQQALESNPMLDVDDEQEENPSFAGSDPTQASDADATTSVDDGRDEPPEPIDTAAQLADDVQSIPEELPVDSAWDDLYEPSYPAPANRSDDSNRDPAEFHGSGGESLHDHLLEQLHLTRLSARDISIATVIIETIEDSGYLGETIDNLAASINREFDDEEAVEIDEIEAVLRLIQRFDPAGVAARDPAECLRLQLQAMENCQAPEISNALRIVERHLPLLAAHDYPKLRRALRLTEDELSQAVALIQTLNPRPGSQISASTAQYVTPDVFVRKFKGVWRVELNPDIAPKLRINTMYSQFVKRADKSDDNAFMRDHLQEARWFIKSLQSRNETLLRVATAIVERQRGFLEYGEEAMKPLVLRDIAEQLEMHESTISRVTTQKYLHSPRGIFEFKYFFSSHVATADGGECSATAIRAMIRKLIAAESSAKPLSDNKIASVLVENGINVARRTIAKYRESMAIPPSNERKRLA